MGRELASGENTPDSYLKKRAIIEYEPLYDQVVKFLPPPNDGMTVVDMGSGVGYLARKLMARGYPECQYLGIDYAPKMVEKAKELVPGCRFILANLKDEETREACRDFRIFVLAEVLEHIEDDGLVLEAISPGSLVVMSVPNFDSKAHVRRFANRKKVMKRYEPYLIFEASTVIEISRRKRIFVFRAVRR